YAFGERLWSSLELTGDLLYILDMAEIRLFEPGGTPPVLGFQNQLTDPENAQTQALVTPEKAVNTFR
ncbi:unnamed protein product, partial [Allacma fusca]